MKRFFVIIVTFGLMAAVSLMAQEATKKRLGGSKTSEPTVEKVESVEGTVKKTLEKKTNDAKTAVSNAIPDNALVGSIVCLNDLVMGNKTTSAANAQKMYERGQPLLFKDVSGKVYVVYNTDGSFAGKKLAKLAGTHFGIIGTVKSINGVRVLIAERYIKG